MKDLFLLWSEILQEVVMIDATGLCNGFSGSVTGFLIQAIEKTFYMFQDIRIVQSILWRTGYEKTKIIGGI